MAYTDISSLGLGSILHTAFDNEIFNQLSVDHRDFEEVEKMRVSDELTRNFKFYLQTSMGPGGVQYRNPGTTARAFPTAHSASATEATVNFKDLQATIELERQLYMYAMSTPEKYAEPLAMQVTSKTEVMKRRIAADLYGDGSGVLGEISSVSVNSATANRAVVTLRNTNTSKGHVGFFEIDEKLIDKTNTGSAGNAPTISSGTFSYWIVTAKNRAAGTVTLAPVNTAGATVNVSAWAPTAGDCLYKNGQPTFPDTTSVTDYATMSEVLVGLESWTAEDSRVVAGLTMSGGALGGSRYDAGGNPIDADHFQGVLDLVKVNVGRSRYNFAKAVSSPETNRALIQSREADRRFQMASDKTRGIEGSLVFLHENDKVELVTSEYCLPKRTIIMPSGKDGRKVMSFIGNSPTPISMPGGQNAFLGVSTTYVDMVNMYLNFSGAIFCRHPKAIGVITNFTNT